MDGGAIGFVVGRLKDLRNVKALANLFVVICTMEGKVEILQNIHSTEQCEQPVIRKCNVFEFDLLRRHGGLLVMLILSSG